MRAPGIQRSKVKSAGRSTRPGGKRDGPGGVLLRTLRVRDFAIIDDVELAFDAGLNVITGETGAGKTLILRALGVVLGGRVDADMVRAGSNEAVVEAGFEACDPEAKRVLERGGFETGGEVVIRRVVSTNGRTRSYVNGGLASLSVLASLAPCLLRVYGQHEHEALRRVESQCELLDAVAGLAMTVEEMQRRFGGFAEARRKLHDLEAQHESAGARAELLRFQVEELGKAAISEGEQASLAAERSRHMNAQRLLDLARGVEAALYSTDGAAIDVVGRAITRLREMAAVDPDVLETLALLEGTLPQLEEAGLWAGRYAERIESDPGRLAAVEARLEEIARLARKYDAPADSLPEMGTRLQAELDGIGVGEETLAEARGTHGAKERDAVQWARKLSVERRRAAKDLESRLDRELATLGMKDAHFTVRFEKPDVAGHVIGPRGWDEVEFYLAPNPGEPARALARVASGGEMSRIMLALKTIGAAATPGAVLIFDEVDAGIGGTVAEIVGRKLKALAGQRQVICITHLPQIAVYSDHHHAVSKGMVEGRTVAVVRRLETSEKIAELARMLGGSTIRRETREHAQQMLRAAAQQA